LNNNNNLLNSTRFEIEKQYYISLFFRELLNNPTDKNGNPLSEAEFFEYLRRVTCILNETEIQNKFYECL